MKWSLAFLAGVVAILSGPAVAQSNNDDYTPLNSRIKRDRQFPLDLPGRFAPERMTRLMRERGKDMLPQFTRVMAHAASRTLACGPTLSTCFFGIDWKTVRSGMIATS